MSRLVEKLRRKSNRSSRKKGITMVEVAVSLAIIGIVSAVALSMSMISATVEARAVTTAYVEGYVESIVECFYFSETDTDFEQTLKKLDPNCKLVSQSSSLGGPEYKITGMGFIIEIKTNITEKAISLVARDAEKTIFAFDHNVDETGN